MSFSFGGGAASGSTGFSFGGAKPPATTAGALGGFGFGGASGTSGTSTTTAATPAFGGFGTAVICQIFDYWLVDRKHRARAEVIIYSNP